MIMNWHCVISYSSFKSICSYNTFFLLLLIENVEAIICSMVFNVKQFRMTWWSGRNIKFQHFNDIQKRDQTIECPIDKDHVSYFPAMFECSSNLIWLERTRNYESI